MTGIWGAGGAGAAAANALMALVNWIIAAANTALLSGGGGATIGKLNRGDWQGRGGDQEDKMTVVVIRDMKSYVSAYSDELA